MPIPSRICCASIQLQLFLPFLNNKDKLTFFFFTSTIINLTFKALKFSVSLISSSSQSSYMKIVTIESENKEFFLELT